MKVDEGMEEDESSGKVGGSGEEGDESFGEMHDDDELRAEVAVSQTCKDSLQLWCHPSYEDEEEYSR